MATLGDANKVIGLSLIMSAAGLAILAVLGFFVSPHYAGAVDTATSAFKDAFLVAGGAKAGLAVATKSTNTPQ